MAEQIRFKIKTTQRLIKIPDFKKREEINIRYPLIEPYSYVHIFWDDEAHELIYFLEEPSLSEQENEVLKLVKLGLEEMINIKYSSSLNTDVLIEYLEKNVQSILLELGIKVSSDAYMKLMYYIYRDSIGLNKIDPLIHDYFIEDIECNGIKSPVYIVHRKFQNIKTNVAYDKIEELSDFVEKLAQKSGRYVSYAKPLLDGTLPDGSRVNATYTQDVTTNGPTFTIRKFTQDPWTSTHLINFKTSTPELFAFMWLVIENKFNIMVIGETGSGKTTFLNSIIHFIPAEARICSIEDTRELNIAHENWLPSVTRVGFGTPSQNGEQYGEISLFDLLRESFRQNPDYVIIGEVRGAEASVLFQGMASGHPSFSTFHSGSVETLIKRLQTPPINLPATLIESLDVVCIASHIKAKEKNIRRILNVMEIKSVDDKGHAEMNKMFEWDAAKDEIKMMTNQSLVLKKITKRTGIPEASLLLEIQRRTKLLKYLSDKNVENFKTLNTIFKEYYNDPDAILKRFGL